MSSPVSDPSVSPSTRPGSVRRDTGHMPCAVCGRFSHTTVQCQFTKKENPLARPTPVDQPQSCAHCASQLHATAACPHSAVLLAGQAFRLHQLEPSARYVLKTGVPTTAPCCDKHSQTDHAVLTKTFGLILQHRSLMPMCLRCVLIRQHELKLDFNAEWRSSIDSCSCAAFVFDNKFCQWCAVQELYTRHKAYEQFHTKLLPHYNYGLTAFLHCECGEIPMGTPKDAAPPGPLVREVLRYCAGCTGVVNVPLHHLDGTNHLACIPGRSSKALVGEDGLVAASVEGEPLGLGVDNNERCIAHPVRTVAQKIIVSKQRNDSGVRLPVPRFDGTQDGPSASRQGEMQPQTAAGRTAQWVAGGMRTQSQASSGISFQWQASRDMATPSPGFGEMGAPQQRKAPVALMVPSTPEEHWEEDTSVRGQLNPGFRFPQ